MIRTLKRQALHIIVIICAMMPLPLSAQMLDSWKDDLFRYPRLLAQSDNGKYQVIDYQEMRDINGRDAIPERRVKQKYISLAPNRAQKNVVFTLGGTKMPAVMTGTTRAPAFIVIYLHGQGGNQLQGSNDYSFGGNFNRIKNLSTRNNGLYITPALQRFDKQGSAQVAQLIRHVKSNASTPLYLACASASGQICWQLMQDANAVNQINGILLLGSLWDNDFLKSPGFQRRIPVFIGHGSHDRVFAIEKQEAFFKAILARQADYPIWLHRFETGTHGTPIRMSDWRLVLNWMAQ